MHYDDKDFADALAAQRNEALNALAAANAVIARLMRELQEAKKPAEEEGERAVP